jgi:cysteine desulfuration protein SufE
MGSMPPKLARIVELFAGAPKDLRVEALLEYSRKVPPLPTHLQGQQGAMEQVEECQTPFFLSTELDEDCRITAWYDCPPEAPTTRGFAGILTEGLNGATAQEVLDVPNDFYTQMGLRLRGMGAILGHLKRQVRQQAADCK